MRVGLDALGRRYPHQLSGGEQQRVALARALAIEPQVVLLDEPFNALDASLRTELAREVVELLAEGATTTVLVTHDREEALALADTVAVLADGRIIALGDPRTLYRDPVDLTAARSLGEVNVLPAEFADDRARTALGEISLRSSAAPGDSAVLLRPEQISLTAADDGRGTRAVVHKTYYEGPDALVTIALEHPGLAPLRARVPASIVLAIGETVWAHVEGPGVPIPATVGSARPQPSRTLDATV